MGPNKKPSIVDMVDTIAALDVNEIYYRNVLDITIKRYRWSRKYMLPLHVRAAMASAMYDTNNAIYHVKKAHYYFIRSLMKYYSKRDIMMFYCMYAWVCIQNSRMPECILALKRMERALLSIGGDMSSVPRISVYMRRLMGIICNITPGVPVDTANEMVTAVADSTPAYMEIIDVLHYSALITKPSIFNRTRYELAKIITDLYKERQDPLIGSYERGSPKKMTDCINEFLAIFTDEPLRFIIDEVSILDIERKYNVVFNRATLKVSQH